MTKVTLVSWDALSVASVLASPTTSTFQFDSVPPGVCILAVIPLHALTSFAVPISLSG